MSILDIRNLTIELETSAGVVKVVDKLSLQIAEGEIHTLVGESGSGKSLLAKAILGFINPRWRITADRLWWRHYDLLALNPAQRRLVTGRDMAMIFQNPGSYLDPNSKVGEQLRELIPAGELKGLYLRRKADRQTRAERLLHRVGIKEAKSIMDSYPYELSEGLAQKSQYRNGYRAQSEVVNCRRTYHCDGAQYSRTNLSLTGQAKRESEHVHLNDHPRFDVHYSRKSAYFTGVLRTIDGGRSN